MTSPTANGQFVAASTFGTPIASIVDFSDGGTMNRISMSAPFKGMQVEELALSLGSGRAPGSVRHATNARFFDPLCLYALVRELRTSAE
jgi:hypothetical protein